MKNMQQKNLICILGLGLSGASAARYLQRIGQDFFVVDTRKKAPGADEITQLSHCRGVYCGEIPQSKVNAASEVILSPGVSPEIDAVRLARQAGVSVVGDVEIFARSTKSKIIAITGSNGKSTVTDLTYQMLKSAGINASMGGNIGIPVLDYLPMDKADIYVLELSSFQLETAESLSATAAVVLNISEDHMDRYNGLEDYRAAKLKVYENADSVLVNQDDPMTWPLNNKYSASFSLSSRTAKYRTQHHSNVIELIANDHRITDAASLKVSGRHNWANALAAIALIELSGFDISAGMIETLNQYQGLSHRFQLVKSDTLADWVNDSKATNVGATIAALKGVDQEYYSPVVLIAGGDAKGADLSPLQEPLASKVDHLTLLGKDAEKIAELFDTNKITRVKDMQAAVSSAKAFIESHASINQKALVLLSPACSSLDMYKNFEARGNEFIHQVEACA